MHPDKGYSNFVSIYETYKDKLSSFNEADTRGKVIDELLKDCLGWGEDEIKREQKVNSGYIDYQLFNMGSCVLVIEAKKGGDYFDIPITYSSRTYKINGAISMVKNLVAAMNQVRSYCNDLGCKYAAVFNGHQMVLFSPISIGRAWTEGTCIIFRSLDDIKENYNQFWNILAFEHVASGSLSKHLERGKRDISFDKVIYSIHNPDQSWSRNELYIYIRPISEFVFSELLDEARMDVLKECYVFGRSNKPLIDEMEEYFIDKLPHFSEKYKIKDIYENEVKTGTFQKEFAEKAYDKTKGALMVLLGGIGAGKSTFLHRFFKLSNHENLLWFYIDFRNAPTSEAEIETFILAKVLNEWGSKFALTLTRILEEVGFAADMTDQKTYFAKLFNLLHHLKFSVALIIDNVDQHDYSLQEKIFLTSHHLTDVLKTVTIVALREETFLTSTRTGIFDAYDTPKFHIGSPNFLEMITKRVDFTLKLLESRAQFIEKIPPDALIDLKKYFSIIRSSLQLENSQSKKIVTLIDNISVGNMREALRMFNNFIVSGNTNIKEIFEKYEQSGSFQIAFHQFVKSITLGEYRYYMQERSHVANVFDFDTSLGDSHYNLLRVLRYLADRFNKRSPIGRGYVLIDDLFSTAADVFIGHEVIADSLLRLSQFNLVEYDNQSRIDLKKASYAKITPAGSYYLTKLIYEFVYHDAILIDTPISDKSSLKELRRLSHATDIKLRLERANIFVNYLAKSELDEIKEHPEYLHNEFTNKYFSEIIISRLKPVEAEIRHKNKLLKKGL